MKPLVIYHDNCADGFGAAFAAWLVLGDDAEYLPVRYEEGIPAEAFLKRDIYILDFSFQRATMDELFMTSTRVVWLDHHKTAFEMWGVSDELDRRGYVTEQRGDGMIILDSNQSGAMLAWEYFHPSAEVPMLFRHIDDYDRWQFKINGTKEFNKALWSYAPWSFAQWRREFLPAEMGKPDLTFAQTSLYSYLCKEGAAILRAHDQNVQSVVKGATRAIVIRHAGEIHGDWHQVATPDVTYPGLAANCPPHLTSDVGHELAVQSGTFGLCWTLAQEDKDGVQIANCSLRSNGDYDVSAIAKTFGGGGHKNAAGFEVPVATLLGWLV